MTKTNRSQFVSSIAWSMATRWGSKLIGLVNTVVLARLLAPEDFGIVAMATILMVMLDSMSQIGVHLYVFRQKEDDPRVFNTGWTINFCQSLFIAGILVVSAPWVASFFGYDVLVNVVYCLALTRFIGGCQNFAVFIAQKQLKFDLDFKLTMATRLAYMISTIGFAIWLQNYWAIIYGQLVSAVVGLVLSYAWHSFRPKFSLFQWRDMYRFSMSTLPLSFGRFVNNQLDVAVIGRVASSDFLGKYHLALNVATLFTKELMMPVVKALVPNIAKIKDNADFHYTLRLIISSAIYLFLPLGVGLAMVAEEFVFVLLGEKWLEIAPLLSWLSLYAMLTGIIMFLSEQFLVVLGLEKLSNKLMWLRNVFMIASIASALFYGNYNHIPIALLGSAVIAFPITLFLVAKGLQVAISFLLALWWPAILATAVMALALYTVASPEWPLWLLLILKVAIAAVLYSGTIVACFLLRGRPENTPEQLFIDRLIN